MLALAIHELATNSRKYGFMLRPEGRLHITWHVAEQTAEEPRLILEWRETETAHLDKAQRSQGYGSQLIERAIPHTLGAEVDYRISDNSVHCMFAIPVSKVMAAEG